MPHCRPWPTRLKSWAWDTDMAGSARYTVILDACVLYPAPLRDVLLSLASEGLFHARWSERIQDEWGRNLLRQRPDLEQEDLQRTCALMSNAIPDCLVTGWEPFEQIITGLDRHVLAAALRGHADAIVTFNLKDFPSDAHDSIAVGTTGRRTGALHSGADPGPGRRLGYTANARPWPHTRRRADRTATLKPGRPPATVTAHPGPAPYTAVSHLLASGTPGLMRRPSVRGAQMPENLMYLAETSLGGPECATRTLQQ